MINRTNFMGLDGFVWWFGVIENRKDPLAVGRCQVRIFGWHTENKNLIPTSDLPWAHPVMPLNSNTGTGIAAKEGDMVFGFFLDSDDAQFPVMLGIVPGIPESTPRIDKGFSDQRTPSQLNDSPRKPESKDYRQDGEGVSIVEGTASRYPQIINESTVSRLTRNENIADTIVEERKKNRVQDVETSSPNSKWSEPETKYNAKYPYNHVYESESGHVLEVDDTPGAERIQTTHRSGTFEEIHPDGTKVTKVVKDKYEIVMSDNNVLIMGDCNITINGQGKIFVKGSADVKVDGDMTTQVTGTYSVTSSGYMSFRAPRIDLN